jgi:hypothetical protein
MQVSRAMEAPSGSERYGDDKAVAGVIVLGSGRSGTSAITRAFVTAGFFAGRDEDLLAPVPSNPRGYYEPLSVLEANEGLLERLGCSWWGDAPLPEDQRPLLAEMKPHLRSILDSLIDRAGDAPVAVKEPRINGLLPLWRPVIDNVLHPVLTVRDPLEIALSHEGRDGTSLSHALASWEIQTTMVLDWLGGRAVTVAPYARLLAEPELVGDVVRDATSHIDPARAKAVTPAEAGAALESDLRRHRSGELSHPDYLTSRQIELWEYVEGLPVGDTRLRVPADLREPSAAARRATRKESERVKLSREHMALYAAHEQAAELLEDSEARLTAALQAAQEAAKREEHFARELQAVASSASWRLTAPLRRVARLLGRSR